MGFLDFVSSAIGAIKDVVSHSPIVKALAPIAGIIAHAVPSVGPIIDTDKVFGQIRDAAEWFSNHQVELRITFMDDDTKFTDLIGERALPEGTNWGMFTYESALLQQDIGSVRTS
ncbi:hypothetical protein M7I_4329 [Glarea lozoyensis 74030]|uniref:Uncharacterized protein n=1 Tax=Glarea lozoyensis (strain ATCC 74030 / MF5533) TaxID=1104152 RepID=H0ENW6_GLAL7|nr:hypothetical protein M7I_4329 [Glarea lozoyensis 74030]